MLDDDAQLQAAVRTKAALRSWALEGRATLSPVELAAAARQIADIVLAAPAVVAARCVAAYASFGREPGTRHLLDELAARDVLVLLPVLLVDRDLDWAEYSGPGDLEPGAHGLLEPVGARLGTHAIAHADVVLVPALAVDQVGVRLGRGGGSYDRALQRAGRTALTCALVYDDEVLPESLRVPSEPHDVAVSCAATPSSLIRFAEP